MIWLSLPLNYLALLCLCLAMPRYAKTINKKIKPSRKQQRLLRAAGCIFLLLALWLNIALLGWGIGITAQFGWLSVAHIAWTLLLSHSPRAALAGLEKIIFPT